MNLSDIIYVGTASRVTAIHKVDGATIWQTKLSGMLGGANLVTLVVENERVYAHTYGKLFCLDCASGEILWTNELPGLGYGIATLATQGISTAAIPAMAEQEGEEEQRRKASRDRR